MKSLFRYSILFLLGFFILSGCGRKEKSIKIGSILPLTGSASPYGKNAQKGILLALKEINSEGGINGDSLAVLFQDDETDASKAVSAFQQLIAINNIQIVIGSTSSSAVLAMAPIAEKNKVVLLSPGASNPNVSQAGEYIFRNWQSDALEGEVDANFAKDNLSWRRVATLYINHAYGTGLNQVFKTQFKKFGGEIVADEGYEQGATDFRAQLSRIAQTKPDGVYLPGFPQEMSIVLRQSREMNLNIRFLSVQGFDDPSILKLAGEAANGVIFSVPKPADTTMAIVKEFRENYRKIYNEEPGVCSDSGYDALSIIAKIMKSGAITGPEIQKQLLTIKDFKGAAGITTFDENGDVIKPFIFKTVKNNQFTFF